MKEKDKIYTRYRYQNINTQNQIIRVNEPCKISIPHRNQFYFIHNNHYSFILSACIQTIHRCKKKQMKQCKTKNIYINIGQNRKKFAKTEHKNTKKKQNTNTGFKV